ncbi:MAG: pyrroline-5-carboxylate reductase [Lachnospiraceae bacterium]|nr:pyrroline-5-carboxylate reductase [Lachnospiraceae bacterium]
MKIGFIGLGNMASAIMQGIISNGVVSASDVYGYDVSDAAKEKAKENQINILGSNLDVASNSDVLILAVKPQFLADAVKELNGKISSNTIVISIVAGRTIEALEELLGEVKIVRTMPNTPALIREAAIGYSFNGLIAEEDKEVVKKILSSFGKAIEVPERLMDAVVGVSGSAPAYVFMFIEAMADGAVAEGMPRALAYEFAAQAVMGSAKLMLETGKHPGELKDMVCSPAGTTIAAVRSLEESGFRGSVMDAVIEASEVSKEL